MKLSDELKEARRAIEVAINEADRRADGRVSGSGRSYGVEKRIRDARTPRTGDGQASK